MGKMFSEEPDGRWFRAVRAPPPTSEWSCFGVSEGVFGLAFCFLWGVQLSVGVQWHAEYEPENHELSRKLFEAFGDAARVRYKARIAQLAGQ